jgi:predicted dithiol-disulfide oxidoreductase (DUF899 family)
MPSSVESPKVASHPKIVGRNEWLEARVALLSKEKALTRMRDAVSAERRALPWVRVERDYSFDTPAGPKTLADLFNGRSQLITYHFMWRREYGEGCVGCSFLSDHIDGANQHLSQHDVSFVAVARAPLASLVTFKQRMGWKFDLISSINSDFNFDYHVSFAPDQLATGKVYYNFQNLPASIEELSGISVFYRPDSGGEIFHTYSSYARGNEEVLGAYMWLDLTPKGRNENGPNFSLSDWVRHHDRYSAGGHVDPSGAYIAPQAAEATGSCCKSDG